MTSRDNTTSDPDPAWWFETKQKLLFNCAAEWGGTGATLSRESHGRQGPDDGKETRIFITRWACALIRAQATDELRHIKATTRPGVDWQRVWNAVGRSETYQAAITAITATLASHELGYDATNVLGPSTLAWVYGEMAR